MKARLIRNELRYSFSIAAGAPIYPGHISEFENGKRKPSLLVLLAYAKLAGVSTDVLIDDALELPSNLPFKKKIGKRE